MFFSSTGQYKKQYPDIDTGRVERLSKLSVFNHILWSPNILRRYLGIKRVRWKLREQGFKPFTKISQLFNQSCSTYSFFFFNLDWTPCEISFSINEYFLPKLTITDPVQRLANL